jgi:uncharacterized protein (DUF488 family)
MSRECVREGTVICTIGHSNRPLDAFVDLLRRNEVRHVIDVRTVPRSRHNPQFGQDVLPASLKSNAIEYTHMPGLGGLRKPRPDSSNLGWRNLSFRGYADYMQTAAFCENVDVVAKLAATRLCALMCAEAVPWRCHRSLIADALVVHGIRAEEIINATRLEEHKLTPFASVDGTVVTYPPPAG